MACPQPTFTDSERIISFSARYILNGLMTGGVTIADPNCEFTFDCAVCQPISVNLDAATSGVCGDCAELGNDECFSQDPFWLVGIVHGYKESNLFEGVPTVSANVVSFADYLNTKPINTEDFEGFGLETILNVLARIYAGIPGTIRDFTIDAITKVKGPVHGNSTLNEFHKLAQAGCAHMFTQVGGILVIEPWKDHTSDVEYVIPAGLITNSEKSPVRPGRVSQVRARGAGVSKYECGEQIFTDSRFSAGQGGYESLGGYLTSCAASGVCTPCVNVTFENLSASEEDLRNANLLTDGVVGSDLTQAQDGTVNTELETDDGTWFDENPREYNLLISGYQRPEYEYNWGDFHNQPLSQQLMAMMQTVHNRWASVSPWPYANNTFLSDFLPFGSQSNTYSSDQPSIERIETEAVDPRFSSCGISSEQIDNPYVPCKERLFKLAVRRFQELRMQENTWLVEVPYIPCLRINQVVEFAPSCLEGCEDRVIKGIITGIDIRYTCDPSVKMKLTIWDTSCIGNNVYQSGNLIIKTCAGQEGGTDNPWLTSALTLDSQASVDNDCGFLYTVGFPSIAWFELSQEEMTVGDDYTISFDYENIQGFDNFIFTSPNGTVGLNGSGTHLQNFTATATTHVFRWQLDNSFIPTAYRICNISITKTVTA